MAEREDPTLAELHERERPPATTPVAVRLPEPLIEELDAMWREQGYESRSAFVRSVLTQVAEEPALFEGPAEDGPDGVLE